MERFRYLLVINEVLKATLLTLCVYATTDFAQSKENIDLSSRLAGGNRIYLTHISLYMTIITLFLSYSVKHFRVSGIEEIYKDSLSITLPMEGLVTTIFWLLNFIDPTLLKNKDLYDAGVRTPLISELSLHLLPLILLLTDQIGVKIKEKSRHYWMFILLAITYFIIIYYFHRLNNGWLYPFLDHISMTTRIVLLSILTSLIIIYYKIFIRISQLTNTLVPTHTQPGNKKSR